MTTTESQVSIASQLQKQFDVLQSAADQHQGVSEAHPSNPDIVQGDGALSADSVASVFGSQTSTTESPNRSFSTYKTAEEEIKVLFEE